MYVDSGIRVKMTIDFCRPDLLDGYPRPRGIDVALRGNRCHRRGIFGLAFLCLDLSFPEGHTFDDIAARVRVLSDAMDSFGFRSSPLQFSEDADAHEWVMNQSGCDHFFHYIIFLLVPP